jgi:hypothetical protein
MPIKRTISTAIKSRFMPFEEQIFLTTNESDFQVFAGEGAPTTPTLSKCASGSASPPVEVRNGFPLNWLVSCGVYKGSCFAWIFYSNSIREKSVSLIKTRKNDVSSHVQKTKSRSSRNASTTFTTFGSSFTSSRQAGSVGITSEQYLFANWNFNRLIKAE